MIVLISKNAPFFRNIFKILIYKDRISIQHHYMSWYTLLQATFIGDECYNWACNRISYAEKWINLRYPWTLALFRKGLSSEARIFESLQILDIESIQYLSVLENSWHYIWQDWRLNTILCINAASGMTLNAFRKETAFFRNRHNRLQATITRVVLSNKNWWGFVRVFLQRVCV